MSTPYTYSGVAVSPVSWYCVGPARLFCATPSFKAMTAVIPAGAGDPIGSSGPADDPESHVVSACGAKLRGKDAHCGNAPGERTDHLGKGKCWLHGGLTPSKHGRYSLIKSERLRAILEEVQKDANPLDLTHEVHALRMLFIDYVNRYDEYTDALLAWHASYQMRYVPTERVVMAIERAVTEWEISINDNYTPTARDQEDISMAKAFVNYFRTPDGARPRQIMDISDAKNILGELGKMVERIEKIRSANAISRPELNRIYQEMWRVIDAWVNEMGKGAMTVDQTLLEIKKGLLNIAL